jgi:hypothetical protein
MKMDGQASARNGLKKCCNLLLTDSYEINMQCLPNFKFLLWSYIIRSKEREQHTVCVWHMYCTTATDVNPIAVNKYIYRYSVIAMKLVTLTEMCLHRCLSDTFHFQEVWINEYAALIFTTTLKNYCIVVCCLSVSYICGSVYAVIIPTGWQITQDGF